MPMSRRVYWKKGLFLRPHHLQQADQWRDDALQARLQPLHPAGYGVRLMETDPAALAAGRLELVQLEAVLPQGTVVSISRLGTRPADREVGPHLPPGATQVGVHVGVPLIRAGTPAIRDAATMGDPPAPFRVCSDGFPDFNTGEDRQSVDYLERNVQILFGDEPLGDYEHLQIGVLRRAPSGALTLDETYIPPILAVGASAHLREAILNDVLGRLEAKAERLYGAASRAAGSILSFGDIASYGLLSVCNRHLPILRHLSRADTVHPRELYLAFASLAGELCTFDPSLRPNGIPDYRHDDLHASTFGPLHRMLGELLARAEPRATFIPLAIERVEETRWRAPIPDDRVFASGGQFFLAASGERDVSTLMTGIMSFVKIASQDQLDQLIGIAGGGIPLHPEPPPPTLPRLENHVYFRLERGESSITQHLWEDIRRSKTLAIYVPVMLGWVQFKLYAVTGGQ